MRRVFPLLVLTATPFLANCADSATEVAPAHAVHSEEAMPTAADWGSEENWWTPGDFIALPEEEMSIQSVNASDENVMTLGNPTVGSPFPTSHDQSIHANDRIIPGTVVIDAGETVTFKGTVGHRMAIYAPGTKPEDILNTNPGPFVLYPYFRLYLQPSTAQQIKLKFNQPGRYLVICAIKTHFFGRNMYGWVIVR